MPVHSGVNFERLVNRYPHLKSINRCPRIGCDGDLWGSVIGDPNGKLSGYLNDTSVAYRCNKCNIRFDISNPRSFINEKDIQAPTSP